LFPSSDAGKETPTPLGSLERAKLYYYMNNIITGSLDFVQRPEFYIIENATFWKLDLFPSSDEGRDTPTLLGSFERPNLNHYMNTQQYVFSILLHWFQALTFISVFSAAFSNVSTIKT
jgi:hypothetical protein